MPFQHTHLELIRSSIAADDVPQAMANLLIWLKGLTVHSKLDVLALAGAKKAWMSSVTNLEAQLNRLEQEEIQGILSSEEAVVRRNRIRAELLKLLAHIDAGILPEAATSPPAKKKNYALLYIGSTLGALGLFILVYFAFLRQPTAEVPSGSQQILPDESEAVARCPDFEGADDFRVMVLPYQVLRGDATNLHLLVSQKIGNLIDRYGIRAAVRSFGRKPEDIPRYPDSPRAAERLGKECQAQLVVWGFTQSDEDNAESLTSFRFVDGDRWRFTEFKLDENLQVDTLRSLAEMAMNGSFTTKIEQAFLLIFGLLAHEAGEQAQTITLLEQAALSPETDPEVFQLQQNFLAEAYQAHGETDKAIEAYSKILAANPKDARAAQNRGVLYYKMEEYAKSAADFDKAIEQEPARKEAVVGRIASNLQLKNTEVVDKDMQRLQNEYFRVEQRVSSPDSSIPDSSTPKSPSATKPQPTPEETKAAKAAEAAEAAKASELRRLKVLMDHRASLGNFDRSRIAPDLLQPRIIFPQLRDSLRQ